TQVGNTGESGKGWVEVDPGLSVLVASSTDQKIRGLRQLFDDLDLDADSLVFTLRSDRGESEATGTTATTQGESADQTYAALTKFLPQIDEVTSTNTATAETDDLRAQFRQAFQEFATPNPAGELHDRTYVEFTPEVVESVPKTQVLAVIQLALQLEEQINPAELHNAMIDGRAHAWMARLQAR